MKESYSHVQKGMRPCIIIQNNFGNSYSPTIIVVPLTTQLKRTDMPTHVIIERNEKESFKPKEMALCECILTVSKDQLKTYIKTLDDKTMQKINVAIMISIGIL